MIPAPARPAHGILAGSRGPGESTQGRGYRARAGVTAECDGSGRTRLTRLRSDGPLALRETREAVYLVGAAAGPLGGDDLAMDVTVGPGARLAVRSAATALALPGDGESLFTVRARVAGHLDFAPEPTVVAAGCHHRAVADIALEEGATLRWYEELILGRHRERPGRHTSRFDVTVGGAPLLRHELRLGDQAIYASGAVLGDAKAVGSVLLVGPCLTREPRTGDGLAVLPLAGQGVLITTTAENSAVLRRRLEQGETAAQTGAATEVVTLPR